MKMGVVLLAKSAWNELLPDQAMESSKNGSRGPKWTTDCACLLLVHQFVWILCSELHAIKMFGKEISSLPPSEIPRSSTLKGCWR
jgi:hypothetical protein